MKEDTNESNRGPHRGDAPESPGNRGPADPIEEAPEDAVMTAARRFMKEHQHLLRRLAE